MVAYSFQRQFVAPIRAGEKRQTIRALRKRHARPGEALQLYAGMRTKHCFKIIADPICERLDDIHIDLRSLAGEKLATEDNDVLARQMVDVAIEVNGRGLTAEEEHQLAMADGFSPCVFTKSREPIWPFIAMVSFWMFEHGPVDFRGVIIRWSPQ